MKTSRFTDSRIIAILKQAEAGTPVTELYREHGISSATFYKWRSKFGAMGASPGQPLQEEGIAFPPRQFSNPVASKQQGNRPSSCRRHVLAAVLRERKADVRDLGSI